MCKDELTEFFAELPEFTERTLPKQCSRNSIGSSKSVFGKGVGNSKNASEMRQKRVKNASKMRQNGSCFIGEKRKVLKCVRNTSKLRQKCAQEMLGSSQLGCIPPLDWARGYARTLLVRHCFLAGLAGASLRQAFGLPQWEGACLARSIPLSHTGFVCGGRLRQAFVCPRGKVQQWENGRK